VWKEPLTVRNRTLTKGPSRTKRSSTTRPAARSPPPTTCCVPQARRQPGADRAPDRPDRVRRRAADPGRAAAYRGWTGKQTENRYSHWIWRQYASAFWDDVRLDRVLPFREARDEEDEKHVHPLQLDVIDRAA
jgi:hypothetical protein